jgi:hypothetical protein
VVLESLQPCPDERIPEKNELFRTCAHGPAGEPAPSSRAPAAAKRILALADASTLGSRVKPGYGEKK